MKFLKSRSAVACITTIIIVFCTLLTVGAAAITGECGENLTWKLENKVLTISGTGDMFDWTSDSPTSSKSAPWQKNRSQIEEIIIEEGVTSIGSKAFSKCEKLKEVVIPKTLSAIGATAFSGTKSNKNVYISDLSAWCKIDFATSTLNPLTTGGCLYINNQKIDTLVAPRDITTLKKNSFHTCSNVKNVIIPNGVISVEKAFYNLGSLTSVTISKSVKNINSEAFLKANSFWPEEINYSGSEEEWRLIEKSEALPINGSVNFNRKTKSVVNSDGVIVYPVDLEQGNYIAVAFYKGDSEQLTECKLCKYNNEQSVAFPTVSDYDKVKIIVLESLENLTPIGVTEICEKAEA